MSYTRISHDTRNLVPEDGVEPPARWSSTNRSTTELLGLKGSALSRNPVLEAGLAPATVASPEGARSPPAMLVADQRIAL